MKTSAGESREHVENERRESVIDYCDDLISLNTVLINCTYSPSDPAIRYPKLECVGNEVGPNLRRLPNLDEESLTKCTNYLRVLSHPRKLRLGNGNAYF